MASFEKLAKAPSTRATMKKQMQELELDADEEAKEAPKKNDVNTPGSKAYLERRQKDAERDLRNAPSRSR